MEIDHAVDAAIKYCLENNVMVDYLKNNQKEVIDMFGFEWNEKEEREALLEIGEAPLLSCYLLVKLQTTLERFSTRLDDLIVELRKGYYTATVQP